MHLILFFSPISIKVSGSIEETNQFTHNKTMATTQVFEDPRFRNSPLNNTKLQFGPRQRVGMQILITFVFMSVLYFGVWKNTEQVLAATKWSHMKMPEEAELPGWVMLLVPIIMIIPGVYIFMFLKYNFNH